MERSGCHACKVIQLNGLTRGSARRNLSGLYERGETIMSDGGFLRSIYLRALLVAPLPAAFIAHAAEPLPDYVTKPIEWRTADGVPQKPIHVNLLPDGRLFFFDPAFTMTPTSFWIWSDADLPDFVTIAPKLPPLAHYFPGVHYDTWYVTDSISCAGHTLAEDRDYSHVFQLPGSVDEPFDILMMGELAQPAFLSTQGPERWRLSNAKRPGSEGLMMPNHGTTTALLPIRGCKTSWGYSNGAIVMAGGQHMTSLEHSIDVYDPSADQWMPRIDMGINRHQGSTVLLPDSRVLLIAGHNDFGLNPGYAQYLDPADGFSLTSGSVEIPETRGYHTITALLPDGRVFLGGGADGGSAGTEKPNFRYYYPDYMLKPRPSLLLAQNTFQLGSYFWVLTGEETPIAELVLVALGATTHSYDMNQRLVEMEIVQRADYGEHTLPIGRAPQSAATAPPGNYMLFALDQERVPSVAKIITLTC